MGEHTGSDRGVRKPDIVVAVDPGTEKTGIAVVERPGRVVHKEIAPTGMAAARIAEYAKAYGASKLVVGDRTSSKKMLRALEESGALAAVDSIVFVDEHLSSLEARRRYLVEHVPRGLARLIPLGLRTPPEPYDDYVAVILAERHFAGRDSCTSQKESGK